MSYGININNAAGDTFFDTSKIGANYLGSFSVAANVNGTFTIPASVRTLVTTTYIQKFMVNDLPTDQEAHSHSVSVNLSTGVVTATKPTTGSQDTHIIVLGK
jgi:hypothetical protein